MSWTKTALFAQIILCCIVRNGKETKRSCSNEERVLDFGPPHCTVVPDSAAVHVAPLRTGCSRSDQDRKVGSRLSDHHFSRVMLDTALGHRRCRDCNWIIPSQSEHFRRKTGDAWFSSSDTQHLWALVRIQHCTQWRVYGGRTFAASDFRHKQ